eukprot:scaffold28952_cov198-Skeletonema_marinoi.AAC.7
MNKAHSQSVAVDSKTVEKLTHVSGEQWIKEGLAIIIVGASGDLAKKKTYPSLLSLFTGNLLPSNVVIYGYARSKITDEQLRAKLRPYLDGKAKNDVIEDFLSRCYYQAGDCYGDLVSWSSLNDSITQYEQDLKDTKGIDRSNRLFYFAIPPNVFAETGGAIKFTCVSPNGFSRMIVEKPFGRDLESCKDILQRLGQHFDEQSLYRIDHYLGKELVQNLMVMRFSNLWMENIWNRNCVQCIMLTFKEPFGTEGRGGYFDQYGIIRDIIQNHLLQVMCLLCMECPNKLDGPGSGEKIRNEKVRLLEAMPPVTIDEVFLGQYEGYTDDETITNKDSNCPTFAIIRCFINNPRWAGVPIIFKAGKALNERKAEMRVQFKPAPAAETLFNGVEVPRNELVMKLQPGESIYLKSNIKTPGFSSTPIQSELEVKYDTRYLAKCSSCNPDAYSRLILDVLRGRSANFVRSDELIRAWEIFTPVLHQIDEENIRPHSYKVGSRGPDEADKFFAEKSGYLRNDAYIWEDGNICRRTTPAEQDSSDANLKAAFDKFAASDKKMDMQGFVGAAVMCGEGFKTMEEAQTAFNTVDKDADGHICFEELKEFLDTV